MPRLGTPRPGADTEPACGEVTGALQAPDGAWRVEIVHSAGNNFARLIHGDDVIDALSITSVKQPLGQAGINMADLIEMAEDAASNQPGAA
jgi:hypothetical protein